MARRTRLLFVTFLTFVRVPFVGLFFLGAIRHVFVPSAGAFVFAFGFLIASAVTDLFDGYFARRLGVVTKFGAHADPLMDKFFYLGTMPLLVFVAVHNGHVRHAMALLVLTVFFLSRDQWVTFLRAVGSAYAAPGGASWAGKLRTSINFPLICAIYYLEESPFRLGVPAVLVYVFEGVALLVNAATIHIYTRRYWPHLRRMFGRRGERVDCAKDV